MKIFIVIAIGLMSLFSGCSAGFLDNHTDKQGTRLEITAPSTEKTITVGDNGDSNVVAKNRKFQIRKNCDGSITIKAVSNE